jgi:hypothetical protein
VLHVLIPRVQGGDRRSGTGCRRSIRMHGRRIETTSVKPAADRGGSHWLWGQCQALSGSRPAA